MREREREWVRHKSFSEIVLGTDFCSGEKVHLENEIIEDILERETNLSNAVKANLKYYQKVITENNPFVQPLIVA